jgi:hypothetical protein
MSRDTGQQNLLSLRRPGLQLTHTDLRLGSKNTRSQSEPTIPRPACSPNVLNCRSRTMLKANFHKALPCRARHPKLSSPNARSTNFSTLRKDHHFHRQGFKVKLNDSSGHPCRKYSQRTCHSSLVLPQKIQCSRQGYTMPVSPKVPAPWAMPFRPRMSTCLVPPQV